ncbi:hypothetical protein KAW38_00750 [Candidatus Micrarchaeota archaeon]|nr:hypothetical protein [Candidatus Micrarchaeota archaeon]
MIYILTALMGALVKITDEIEDKLGGKGNLKYLFAIAYGIIGAYLVAYSPFTTIMLGIFLGVFLAGKIDTTAHRVAAVIILLGAILLGVPQVDMLYLFIFTVLAVGDEVEWNFNRYRPFVKIGAIVISFVTWTWGYMLFIVLFDGAYLLTERLMKIITRG